MKVRHGDNLRFLNTNCSSIAVLFNEGILYEIVMFVTITIHISEGSGTDDKRGRAADRHDQQAGTRTEEGSAHHKGQQR